MLLKVGWPQELSSDLLCALRAAKVTTVEQLFAADTQSLILRIPQLHAEPGLLHLILGKIYAKVVLPPRTLAESYSRLLASQAVLSTGDRSLDTKLAGGLFTGDHVEVCGSQTDRSAFCHRVVSHLLNEDPTATVLYIDSGCYVRVETLVDDFKVSLDSLERLQVLQTDEFPELLRLLDRLQQGQLHVAEKPGAPSSSTVDGKLTILRPRLIVIDSICELINPLLLHAEDIVCTLGLVGHVGCTLRSVASHQKLVVLTTNDIMNGEPSLGKMWAGSPHIRLLINESALASMSSTCTANNVQVLRSYRATV